jgi:hypothetical protein
MKRVALLLILSLSAIAVPAFAEDVALLGFTGYDYEFPNPNAGTYLAMGEGYNAIGFVTEFTNALFTGHVNPVLNEYTFRYTDLTVVTYDYSNDFLFVTFSQPGRGQFYEDPKSGGTAAQYGVHPPNATAPSTFVDGTLILGGSLQNMYLWYDYVGNTGAFNADFTLDEGSLLYLIPESQRAGWTISGLAGRPNPAVPEGYDHQINGEVRIPGVTSAQHKTWGALKSLYR